MEETVVTGAGLLFLAIIVVVGLVTLLSLGIWIWSIVSVLQNPMLDNNGRLMWILVIFFAGVIGSIVYLVAGRNDSGETFAQHKPQYAPRGKPY